MPSVFTSVQEVKRYVVAIIYSASLHSRLDKKLQLLEAFLQSAEKNDKTSKASKSFFVFSDTNSQAEHEGSFGFK